jgi:hypothetical protein
MATFELPGVRRHQIQVIISQGIMHVRGTRVPHVLQERCSGTASSSPDSPSTGNASVRHPVQELRYGCFGRGVKLPEGIKVWATWIYC